MVGGGILALNITQACLGLPKEPFGVTIYNQTPCIHSLWPNVNADSSGAVEQMAAFAMLRP